MSDISKFTMKDEKFICRVCKKDVDKLNYTARDHCPYCLHSIHIDINPGDRMCNCLGTLEPIAIENFKKGKYKIVYKCDKCGMIKKNVMANDDNMDLVIEIMTNSNPY